MREKDLFLHALSRFRSALPEGTRSDWAARHCYDVALALHARLSKMAPGNPPTFAIYSNQATDLVFGIAVRFLDETIDLYGSQAEQRIHDSLFESDEILAVTLCSTPEQLFDDLDRLDFFATYWDAPEGFKDRLSNDIANAAGDFLGASLGKELTRV